MRNSDMYFNKFELSALYCIDVSEEAHVHFKRWKRVHEGLSKLNCREDHFKILYVSYVISL